MDIMPVLKDAQQKVTPGIYQHFRTKQYYKVIGTAWHSETVEPMVIYQALYDAGEKFGKDALWVRPQVMFMEEVEANGVMVPRFRLIEAS